MCLGDPTGSASGSSSVAIASSSHTRGTEGVKVERRCCPEACDNSQNPPMMTATRNTTWDINLNLFITDLRGNFGNVDQRKVCTSSYVRVFVGNGENL